MKLDCLLFQVDLAHSLCVEKIFQISPQWRIAWQGKQNSRRGLGMALLLQTHTKTRQIFMPLSPIHPTQTFPIMLLIKSSLLRYFLLFWVPRIGSFHPGLILFGPFAWKQRRLAHSLPGLFKDPEVCKQERFPLRQRALPWSKDGSWIRISPRSSAISTFHIRCFLGGHVASHPWQRCQACCQKSKGHTELTGRISCSCSVC